MPRGRKRLNQAVEVLAPFDTHSPDQTPFYIDEAAEVAPEHIAAALGRSIPDQVADLVSDAQRAETRVRHAAVLAKLARDFGPETAKLAEQFAERALTNRPKRPSDREARKLVAAGRYGFR